jgi:hypothetical protein
MPTLFGSQIWYYKSSILMRVEWLKDHRPGSAHYYDLFRLSHSDQEMIPKSGLGSLSSIVKYSSA